MNDYEKLLSDIQKELPVIEVPLKQITGDDGYYRNGKIFIDRYLLSFQKKERLLEEYGHYKTTVGTIIDETKLDHRKQELKARRYGYDMLVSLDDLIDCAKWNFDTLQGSADYLDISLETLLGVIDHCRQKYGNVYFYNGYELIFDDMRVVVRNAI